MKIQVMIEKARISAELVAFVAVLSLFTVESVRSEGTGFKVTLRYNGEVGVYNLLCYLRDEAYVHGFRMFEFTAWQGSLTYWARQGEYPTIEQVDYFDGSTVRIDTWERARYFYFG